MALATPGSGNSKLVTLVKLVALITLVILVILVTLGDPGGTGDNKLVLVWPWWEQPGNSKLDSGICLGIEIPCYSVSAREDIWCS